MNTVLIIVAVTTLMILLNALYVAGEFATVSARRIRISQQRLAGNRLAVLLEPIMRDPHQLDTYVAACQLGITASSLVLGFYGQSAIARALYPWLGQLGGLQMEAAQSLAVVIVLVFLTSLQAIFGELVPKSVAIRYPERLALFTILPMRWSMAFFRPAIALFNGTATLILRLLRVSPAAEHLHIHSPQEIQLLMAESARGGLLDSDERLLLRNAFRISNLTAANVMVPRTRLIAAPLGTSCRKLLEMATTTGFTRIPLYRETIDAIAGIVHLKDLFRLDLEGRDDVETILRQVPFVPEGAPVVDVWNRMRQERDYVSIVFDEFGGTAGLISMEDLIEQIFGELQDEFDQEAALIAAGPGDMTRLHGEVLISDVNDLFDLDLPREAAHTIGGLIMAELGRLPEVGSEVMIGAIRLRVEAVDGRAVREVSLFRPPAPGPEQPTEAEAP